MDVSREGSSAGNAEYARVWGKVLEARWGGGEKDEGELPSISALVAVSAEGSSAEDAEYARLWWEALEAKDEEELRSGVPSISLMIYDGGGGERVVDVVVGWMVLRRVSLGEAGGGVW